MNDIQIILDYASLGVAEAVVASIISLSIAVSLCAVAWWLVRSLETFLAYRVEMKQLADELEKGKFSDDERE